MSRRSRFTSHALSIAQSIRCSSVSLSPDLESKAKGALIDDHFDLTVTTTNNRHLTYQC
uniref:Uncharacterized protein n=1 Tax=Kalanchoe fedtschenkoi TaxID=63787 RepID=A0A7N0TT29_KALFE